MKPWNKCDICGKFISYADFESERAHRVLVNPDSHYSTEEYDTYHTACHNKLPRNQGKKAAVYQGNHFWVFKPI